MKQAREAVANYPLSTQQKPLSDDSTTEQGSNLTQTALTWLKGTCDLSDDQMRNGLNQLVRMGDEWPPPLPKFRRLCIHGTDAQRTYLGLDYPELTTPNRTLHSADRKSQNTHTPRH